MTQSPHRNASNEEAIRWVVRMHSDQVTQEDERLFSEWLDDDSDHFRAYENQTTIWRSIGDLTCDDDNRASLAKLRDIPENSTRRDFMAASVAAGLLGTGIAGWMAWEAWSDRRTYSTATGEQQRRILADGSTITLDTDTTVRVDLRDAERRLWLDKGQAFFVVAKDAARPFRVFVDGDEVRALGTAFDVRRDGSHARVTLEEGAVAIFRAVDQRPIATRKSPSKPDVLLKPGEQALLADAELAPQIRTIVAGDVGAWRFGRMVLERESLSDAVTEINRYNARKIVIVDPSIEPISINGVFQTGSPEAFVDALTAAFPVRVKRQNDKAIYLVGATPPPGRI